MSSLDARWGEISPHLDHLLGLPGDERAQWIESLRANQPELAILLKQLFEEHRELSQEHFLEHSMSAASEPSLSGRTVGAYTLLSPIGQGGMGSVWLAERNDGRFERRVAIKFLRFVVAAHDGAERFEREGRILGQLAHPHVSELIDAGVAPTGEPYLVLEYVEGEPIDQYCDKHGLDLGARLRLFFDVLDAVTHAHAHLAVHRDIKPANVLVRNDGQVKLLDFGIAKLLEDAANPAAATMLTLEGGAAMTPHFAAPEQVSSGAITTATDVYALGVLLYLLLTGVHPAGPGLHSTADLIKAVVETDPPLASEALASLTDAASAEKRATTPDKLARTLRGDLDTIIARALKKKPQERYASVAAFGDDLRRYLAHEPIAARPDTFSYRLRKYARRHRVGVAVSTAFVLLLAGFTVIQASELQRITRERDRANRVTQFMKGMFRSASPSAARGNTVTVREVLDKASKDIEAGLGKDPELQAQMMNVMGGVYNDLGLNPSAESLLTRAIELRRRVLGAKHPDTLESERLLSWVLLGEGRYAEAEKLQRETLDADRRVLGLDNPETLLSMSHLGTALFMEGRYADAERVFREALVIRRRVLGTEHPDTLSSMNNLGGVLSVEGRYDDAEELQRETVAVERRVLGSDHPNTLSAMNNLASTLAKKRRYDEAEELEHEALDTERRVLGPDHPATLALTSYLGAILSHAGRYSDAEQMMRQALEADRRVLGPEHPQTAECVYGLGAVAALKGNRDEALSLIRQAVDHGLPAHFDLEGIGQNDDLKALHGDPRFAALIAHAKDVARKQTAQQKRN